MRLPSPWLVVVIILLGVFILRDPRLQQVEEAFLGWLLSHTESAVPAAPITQVEIGREDFRRLTPPDALKPLPDGEAARRSLSPLEFALFLQAALEFRPTVIALEPILIWRDRDKTQEQVFIDQAMRVPKLLVSLSLGDDHSSPEISPDDLPTFANVTGNSGDLAAFSGISRQPDEDIRLISTPGFINLPPSHSDRLRVPMLFAYRGAIVPSFPLQAIMLWLRLSPGEVKIELGSRIVLPNGWQIPLDRDGTTRINPVANGSVRRLSLNELLLAAQEHEQNRPSTRKLENLKDQIVLLRLTGDPLQPPNVFAAAIATIQTNAYPRSAAPVIGWAMVASAALFTCVLWMISRTTLLLGALAFAAGYLLFALQMLAHFRLWLPTFLPLTLLACLVIARMAVPPGGEKKAAAG